MREVRDFTRNRSLELVDMGTGEVVQRKIRTPHSFEGKGYTLESRGEEFTNYELGLSGNEWDIIDWMRHNGGAASPVQIVPSRLAPQLHCVLATVKTSIARLVKIGLVMRVGGFRSGMYQLNPRRHWEGSGDLQVKACVLINPPPIRPDERTASIALRSALKTAESAKSAADLASETASAMPGSKVAASAAAAAAEARSSAVLAAQTAVKLGAKLPLNLSRLLKEETP